MASLVELFIIAQHLVTLCFSLIVLVLIFQTIEQAQDHPTDFRPTRRHIDMNKYPVLSACSAMYDRHPVPVEALPRPLPLVRPVARETGMGAAARRLLSRGGMEAPTGTHFVPLSQRVPLA